MEARVRLFNKNKAEDPANKVAVATPHARGARLEGP